MSYSRFAIYYVPPKGSLAEFGASWLGWDIIEGCAAHQPDLPGLGEVTKTPRKYGFHGTLKPPFRLQAGRTCHELERALQKTATKMPPVRCDGLTLTRLGSFLALTAQGDTTALNDLAAACVRQFDGFRAPPEQAELVRRNKAGLNARQQELLAVWGYPYVMEEFRFHMTLSKRLPKSEAAKWHDVLLSALPDLPAPFLIDQVALCGERADGCFELIQRYALTG